MDMPQVNLPRRLPMRCACRGAVSLMLIVHAVLLAWGAWQHSPSWDEVGHLPAGLSHWRIGRFDLYRVNPPLVRAWATVPVVLLRPEVDWRGYEAHAGSRPEWRIGQQFIRVNGDGSFWYFTVARWACIPLSLLGGIVCWRWAGELYGGYAALLALALWCFCPSILGNGQMLTPDVGAAALGITACYTFWRWLREPGWTSALVAGLCLGLAELTKFTWVVLFVIWPVLWLIWRRPPGRAGDWVDLARPVSLR